MEKYIDVIEWVYNIAVLTILIPASIAVFKWKFLNFPLKMVGLLYIRGFILGTLSLYYASINDSHRYLYYLSPCLDIILMTLLFVSIFDFKKEIKWVLALLCVIFIALMINDYFNTKNASGGYLTASETIFVIVVSILMLQKIVLEYKSGIYKKALLWIISAILIGNLFALLIQALMETFSAYSTDFMQLCWYLSSPLFIVITNLMVAYGFYIIRGKVRVK